MDPEMELRRLASKISTIIHSKPDVLGGHIANVPDISTAKFKISVDAGLESRPKAYQYIEHFESMVRSPEIKELMKQLQDVEAAECALEVLERLAARIPRHAERTRLCR